MMKRTASPPELLIPLSERSDSPLRVQLERGLRDRIRSGQLAAGTPLPSTRILAADLGISRGVVVEAYEQLLSEGYLVAQRGSGTRVAARDTEKALPDAAEAPRPSFRYDFRPGVPDVGLFPRREWLTSVRRALSDAPASMFDYPDPRGVEPARVAISAYLNRVRATVARPDCVVFCNGFPQAVRLLAQVLRQRGRKRLAVEEPGYNEQWADMTSEGLELVRIPVDRDGIDVDALQQTEADAVLVTPAHQYPTGAVLSRERRVALLGWAKKRDGLVIEDDYDAEYRYDREPVGTLQGMAPNHVIYIGTASKTLSPGLRMAWLLVPPGLARDITEAKLNADRGSSTIEQLTLAKFLEHGELDRHLRRTRLIYRRRRDELIASLAAHLPEATPQGIAAGLHVMVELPPALDEQAVVDAAARRSIRVGAASRYRANPRSGPPALVLGYGAATEIAVAEGIRQLAAIVRASGR